jgi:CMP-N-acetylneuraminic acid synthetase
LSKTIAIIPARGGSKRIPNKNIKLLGGIPLIVHSINYAKSNSDTIEDIYVSTNDKQIKEIALKNGVKVIDRPDTISGDLEPTITAVQHVIKVVKDVDNVVLLQPTNPLRPKNLLNEAYQLFLEKRADSLFTVSRDYNKLGKINNNKFLPFNYKIGQRSQDLEPLYFENGLLYIATSKTIKAGFVISPEAYPLEVSHIFSQIDIDEEEDLEYATYIYNKHKNL